MASIRKLSICVGSALLLMASSAMAAPRTATVRSLNTELPDESKIIVPESFETDVHKMMQNWYLQNYAVLDKDADRREAVTASDRDYIDRLQRINTVIELPYNKIVRSFINMYAERKKGLVEAMLGMSLYYMPIFEQALDKYGMPMELKYLPIIESALNPNAVSRAGATGLWQLMSATATGLGLEVNSVVDQRRDPYTSSDAAARYLRQLYRTSGDWSLTIAAYNCGPGNVNKALRRAGGGKRDFWEIYRFLPRETRDYIPAYIAATYIMNHYDKHNISPALASKPNVTDTVHLSRPVHIEQISEVMDIPIEEIRILNPQYRQDVIPGNIKPYPLALPNMQVYCYIANEDSIVNHNAEKYARREVVNPSMETKSKDERGEYVEELVVKYHKVRRGETLSSIANRYGVSASEIRKTNNIGRKVKRGKTLRINTYRRRYIETPADTTATEAKNTAVSDSTAVVPVKEQPAVRQEEVVEKPQRKQTKPKAEPKPKNVKHKIQKGENLSKIAAKYGVSVDDIRQANNIKGDRIQMGETLNIPSKAKKSSSRKSSSRRRRR